MFEGKGLGGYSKGAGFVKVILARGGGLRGEG